VRRRGGGLREVPELVEGEASGVTGLGTVGGKREGGGFVSVTRDRGGYVMRANGGGMGGSGLPMTQCALYGGGGVAGAQGSGRRG